MKAMMKWLLGAALMLPAMALAPRLGVVGFADPGVFVGWLAQKVRRDRIIWWGTIETARTSICVS